MHSRSRARGLAHRQTRVTRVSAPNFQIQFLPLLFIAADANYIPPSGVAKYFITRDAQWRVHYSMDSDATAPSPRCALSFARKYFHRVNKCSLQQHTTLQSAPRRRDVVVSLIVDYFSMLETSARARARARPPVRATFEIRQ